MGEGDPVVGALRSLQAGVLDIPWAPNRHVAGKVIPILDASRAVRYLHHAGLPLDNEVLDYHREKIREREKKEGRPVDFEAAIQDVTEVSQMLDACGYEEGH